MTYLVLPRPPWIVGHRGAAGEVRENTVPSFRRALEQNVDMIELDVQITGDEELVCFHDWTLERLAGRSDVIEQSNVADLKRFPIGPSSARIPTFREALEAIPDSVAVNVEVKVRKAPRRRLAAAVLEALGERRQVLLSSFDRKLLEAVRRLAPDLPLAPIEKHQPRALIETGQALGAFSLHCHRRLVTRHFVERAAAAGFERILAYTVNDEDLADRLLEDGITGIFTDLPGKLVEHLKGRR